MDRIILGENAIFSSDSNETGLNNNVIVCGSSGCGKTMSISEPMLLESHDSSLIVTVSKRRIVNKYKAMLERRGYVVEDLNFVDPASSSVAYDPLKYVKSYADITYLAESIVKSNPRKNNSNADPYWDEAAASLCSSEIAYTMMTKGRGEATFADVVELHNSIDFVEENGQIVTTLDNRFDRIGEKDPHSFAVSCWKSFRKLPIRTASCVFGTLNTTMDTIFSPEILKMIKMKKKIDFEQLASRKTVLFVSSSAVNPSLHFFINMLYSQAFKSLFEYAEKMPDGKLPLPVRVLCDDFATGSRILNFPEYISIFREKQISVTVLVQSESQLESMYGCDDAKTIINNCDTYLYMGGMDIRTGRSISERLNMPLEDVLYMPIGQEYIFRRGQKPITTTRYDILKDRQYQEVTREYEERIAEWNR